MKKSILSIITLSLLASSMLSANENPKEKHYHNFMNKIKHHHNFMNKIKHHHNFMNKIKHHRKVIFKEIKDYKVEKQQLNNLTEKSHINYNKNDNGLITVSTLTKWIDNWKKNKPEGIEGKLIILQGGSTLYKNRGKGYITPKEDEGVFVYNIGPKGACDLSLKRFDGVSDIQGTIINSDMMNFQLNALNINPTKDMIVLVTTDSDDAAMKGLTRVWFTMKYYSIDMKHVSFLNGSASYNFAPKTKNYKYLSATPSGWPQFGNFDIKTLGPKGVISMATTEDMMKAASEKINFHFIVDGRDKTEFTGEEVSNASDSICGDDGKSQCVTAFTGHIKTAKSMPYQTFYDNKGKKDINEDGIIDSKDASYKFKSFKQLKKYFRKKGYRKNQIVDAYCRTGRKANLAMFAATQILGYPGRMYDGSWVQWGELANNKDTNGVVILPKDNKWRTDTPKYSVIVKYENPKNVQPIEHVTFDNNLNTLNTDGKVRIDINGTTTQLQVDEDRKSLQTN